MEAGLLGARGLGHIARFAGVAGGAGARGDQARVGGSGGRGREGKAETALLAAKWAPGGRVRRTQGVPGYSWGKAASWKTHLSKSLWIFEGSRPKLFQLIFRINERPL